MTFPLFSNKAMSYYSLKFIFIALMILLLLIPLKMVTGILSSRHELQEVAAQEVYSLWGNEQNITGPILVLPYHYSEKSAKGKIEFHRGKAYLFPGQLNIKAHLDPQLKYRGIFKFIVYEGQINLSGAFKISDLLASENLAETSIDWKGAFVILGLSDPKGLQQQINLDWNKEMLEFISGLKGAKILHAGAGMHAQIPSLNSLGIKPFSISLKLKGAQSILFSPIGKDNIIEMISSWPDPSFIGTSPSTQQISTQGFKANWNVPYYQRNYPQIILESAIDSNMSFQIENSAVGVKLLNQVDFYRMCERATKYGVLFFSLTFIAYFLFEILLKVKIHPIQYTLVGLSLVLFYLLLLALSEFVAFYYAYAIAGFANIALVSLYTYSFTRLRRRLLGWSVAVILSMLYLYLYLLLQLEQMSLLFGAIGLFAMMASVMYATRRVDWFQINN